MNTFCLPFRASLGLAVTGCLLWLALWLALEDTLDAPSVSVAQMEGLVPPSIGHDFMFSESELSDILEFMQRSDADGATGPNALGPPPFLGSTAPTSLALSMQFLPHAPEELPLGLALPLQSPAPSYSSDEVFVKAEGCNARGALAQGMASVNGSTSQLFPAVPQPAAAAAAARPRAPLPRGTDAGAGFAERAHAASKKGAPALARAPCGSALVIARQSVVPDPK